MVCGLFTYIIVDGDCDCKHSCNPNTQKEDAQGECCDENLKCCKECDGEFYEVRIRIRRSIASIFYCQICDHFLCTKLYTTPYRTSFDKKQLLIELTLEYEKRKKKKNRKKKRKKSLTRFWELDIRTLISRLLILVSNMPHKLMM